MGEVTGTIPKVTKAWKWYHGIPVSKGAPTSGHYGHSGGHGGAGNPGGSKPGGGHHTIAGVKPGMNRSDLEGKILDHKEGRGEGGPRSRVAVGDRMTTLREFTRKDIPKARDALSDYEKGHKLSVKSRSRVQEARWKLNGVRGQLGKPGQGKAVRNAAKVVARIEKPGPTGGVTGVVFYDIYYEH